MGCVNSRQDINDVHPNIFNVMNVNETGQSISSGQLELTESELILYQRGKTATRWPLRCLRRYGYDSEIFSFEAGRRCTTGPGIYAFRCRRAEHLFNMLQSYIQLRNLSDDLATVANELQIPVATSGPPVTTRVLPEAQYLPENRPSRPNIRLSRPGSVTSNGPPSPPILSPPPLPEMNQQENNNNKRLILQHSYSNSLALDAEQNQSSNIQSNQPYMNLEPNSPTLSSNSEPYAQLNMETEESHVYINVTPGEMQKCIIETRKSSLQDALLDCENDDRHCYANLNPDEIENLNLLTAAQNEAHSINYIVLDLKESNSTKVENVSNQLPESPKNVSKGYATIDFNKTVALSHSVNPSIELDNEGSRKTRHNSTIGEIAPILARHSTSLSD